MIAFILVFVVVGFAVPLSFDIYQRGRKNVVAEGIREVRAQTGEAVDWIVAAGFIWLLYHLIVALFHLIRWIFHKL